MGQQYKCFLFSQRCSAMQDGGDNINIVRRIITTLLFDRIREAEEP